MYDGDMPKDNIDQYRLTIRLPDDLHEKLKDFKKKKGFMQLSATARFLMVKGLESEEKPTYLVKSP